MKDTGKTMCMISLHALHIYGFWVIYSVKSKDQSVCSYAKGCLQITQPKNDDYTCMYKDIFHDYSEIKNTFSELGSLI